MCVLDHSNALYMFSMQRGASIRPRKEGSIIHWFFCSLVDGFADIGSIIFKPHRLSRLNVILPIVWTPQLNGVGHEMHINQSKKGEKDLC